MSERVEAGYQGKGNYKRLWCHWLGHVNWIMVQPFSWRYAMVCLRCHAFGEFSNVRVGDIVRNKLEGS